MQGILGWKKFYLIDKFFLWGHSYGGYISGMYASKYPYDIIRLYLISPAGLY